ncbi:MAG: hypothetical protein WBA43_16780 [Elainellaceae cyanobacterium]
MVVNRGRSLLHNQGSDRLFHRNLGGVEPSVSRQIVGMAANLHS